MQKMFLGTAMALTLVCLVSCSSSKHSKIKRIPGTWQAQPITIDGSNKDWPSPYPEYDDKAMLGYAVSNDKDNLYITVETGDPATQLKILRNGLTVWIDKTANKEELTAINYPIPITSSGDSKQSGDKPQSGQMQQGQGGGGNAQDKQRQILEDKVSRAMDDAKEYSLQGFKSCNLQFPILEKDTCGIVVRIGLDGDTNELVWEAVVPFKSFYYKSQIARSDKGKPISICFETEGLKRPAGQGSGNHGGGGTRYAAQYRYGRHGKWVCAWAAAVCIMGGNRNGRTITTASWSLPIRVPRLIRWQGLPFRNEVNWLIG